MCIIILLYCLQVPLGHKGTIVGVHSEVDPNPVRQENQRRADMFYDILFDEQFDEGASIEGIVTKRLYKVSKLHLINITYGMGKCCLIVIKKETNYYYFSFR